MATPDPQIDAYLSALTEWQAESTRLREILLDYDVVEAMKWRQPCYAYEGRNLFIISGFKAYCCLSFFEGALLSDPQGVLVAPGKDSQASRQIRFTSVEQVDASEATIRAYIAEAIAAHDAGRRVVFDKTKNTGIPPELEAKFADTQGLRDAFFALPRGKQRGYILHFSGAKQSATVTRRIEKFIPRILDGKGFHDCVCGQSKRYPRCDGSHKDLASTAS